MRSISVPAFLFSIFLLSCGDEIPVAADVAYPWDVDPAKFDFAKYVDPVIGTDGHGHTFPGATAPFGMVQLSPDTRVDGSWDGCSGYHYSDTFIYGFSHTHLSGTGCSDYGDVLLMPGTGEIQYENGDDGKPGYRSAFQHKNETAKAGYYSVVLDNSGTKVELTASPRVGVHRYTFPQAKEKWILLDLAHRDEVIDAHVELVDDHTIRGYRFSKAWATDQRVWFYAEFSESFTSKPFGKTEMDSASGKNVKWAFAFDTDQPVTVKVALSPVSGENAKLNMQAEVPGWDFDAVRKKVVQQWNTELGRIEVKSGDETKKKIFYTALYHCCIAPNLYCDVNGDYRGRDGKTHRDTIHPQYTVFSLWDTYRALHPLFTIIQQKRTNDFINTFVKQAQEGGRLPVWELSANETDCMIGYHSVPVIVDAWMKGLTDWDTATAYEAMKASAMADERGLEQYKQCGFIPAEGESESVSKTLEYAYDDWCIAEAAKRMKDEDDYKLFSRRAQSWRNLYDRETGFFRPRLNNSFVDLFHPAEVNFHFTEANAWQYSLAVQHDIPGLIAMHGGDKQFIAHLDSLFSVSSETSGREQADITGLIGQYAQGNEPSHHMAYLYMYTSQPWKGQRMIADICEKLYTDKPDGLCGNEDCGQMSAWYVMSMLGLYDVTPGSGQLKIGTPGFSETVIHLENGKTFTINARLLVRASTTFVEGPYSTVNSVRLNNVELTKPTLPFAAINNGGELVFHVDLQEVSPFMPDSIAPANYVPTVPLVTKAGERGLHGFFGLQRTFFDELEATIVNDGSSTTFVSINEGPFNASPSRMIFRETSTVRAFAKNNEGVCSDTATFTYTKIPFARGISLVGGYAPQYSAGGNFALVDGIRGGNNFRTGAWQGYEGINIEVTVHLGEARSISRIDIGFLQDQNAWIFMPEQVTFYTSTDGKNFTELEAVKNTIAADHDGPITHDFYSRKPVKASYVKVIAKNRGVCPAWHPGAGKPCWLFADEITVTTD
jgi:predicted alpha-1,2-mannosidase